MLKLCLYLATHTCIFTYVAAGNICSSLSVCNTTWRCKKDERITLLEQDHCPEEKQRLKQQNFPQILYLTVGRYNDFKQ